MPLHKIGRVGIVFYSEWEANRVYSYLDYVRTGGNCYMCVAEHLSDELNKPKDGADSTFWRVVVDNSTTKLELLQNIDDKIELTKAELLAYIGEVMANLNKAVIVDTLPDTGEIGTLYLVANGGSDDNLYDEYIYINKGSEANPNFVFEKLGTKEIDLSGYYDKNEVDLKNSALQEQINALKNNQSSGAKFADLFKFDFPSELNLPMVVQVNNGGMSFGVRINTLDEAIEHFIETNLKNAGLDYAITTEQTGADISIFVKFKDNSQKIIQTKDMSLVQSEKAVKIDDEIHAKFPTNNDKSAFTSYANEQKSGVITFKYDLDGKTLYKHPTYSFIDDETIMCEFAFPVGATNCFYRLNKTTTPECMRVDTNGDSVSIFSQSHPYAPLNANGEVLGVIDEWVNFEGDLRIKTFMWEYTEPLKIQKVAKLVVGIEHEMVM